jgi:predicted Rossmann-fold nucleotide-binding protein
MRARNINVCFIGSSSPQQVKTHAESLKKIGEALALNTTIQVILGGLHASGEILIKEYVQLTDKKPWAILPDPEIMATYAGEPQTVEEYLQTPYFSEVTGTNYDCVNRGRVMVERSDVVIACTGGGGTLDEMLHGLQSGKEVHCLETPAFVDLVNERLVDGGWDTLQQQYPGDPEGVLGRLIVYISVEKLVGAISNFARVGNSI